MLYTSAGDIIPAGDEDRFVLIDMSNRNNLLVVVHTDRNDRIRIISVLKVTEKEKQQYKSYEK